MICKYIAASMQNSITSCPRTPLEPRWAGVLASACQAAFDLGFIVPSPLTGNLGLGCFCRTQAGKSDVSIHLVRLLPLKLRFHRRELTTFRRKLEVERQMLLVQERRTVSFSDGYLEVIGGIICRDHWGDELSVRNNGANEAEQMKPRIMVCCLPSR